ncbi:hypothetical protein LP421_32000 (plasmid) [Rhizobium sp. RCAM05350]|nr:hypothetical protein LP421_32000 [Rhizobium sp. RCAM05350]
MKTASIFRLWDWSSRIASTIRETEAVRLTRLMQAFGYVEARTEVLKGADGQSVLRPEPGNIYSLGYVALNGLSGSIAGALQTKLQFVTDRYMGQAARADTIAVIRRDVLRVTEESQFPAPVVRSDGHPEIFPDAARRAGHFDGNRSASQVW